MVTVFQRRESRGKRSHSPGVIWLISGSPSPEHISSALLFCAGYLGPSILPFSSPFRSWWWTLSMWLSGSGSLAQGLQPGAVLAGQYLTPFIGHLALEKTVIPKDFQ